MLSVWVFFTEKHFISWQLEKKRLFLRAVFKAHCNGCGFSCDKTKAGQTTSIFYHKSWPLFHLNLQLKAAYLFSDNASRQPDDKQQPQTPHLDFRKICL